jgi:dihydroorotate dehydrogenase electron transfer subunit
MIHANESRLDESAGACSTVFHKACYADDAWHGTAEVVENVRLARDTYRLRLDCPPIARRIVPGQFVMLRLAGCNDPLLGRPLALYDTVLAADGEPIGIDVVHLVVGKMTRRLADLSVGARLEVWGPLGNGFALVPTNHLVMVAGGIGQTPFPALARAYLGRRGYGDARTEGGWDGAQATPQTSAATPGASLRSDPATRRVSLCYGARTADYLAGVEDFRRLGVQVHLSTDDGSAGHHGLVTDVLRRVLANSECGIRNAELEDATASPENNSEFRIPNSALHIACCGPEPMMEAVAHIAQEHGVSCQVSLESPMACGIGICFSCVAKVRQADGSWDYRRTCVEGPVFDAREIVW